MPPHSGDAPSATTGPARAPMEPSLHMWRLIPQSGLLVFPSCGHTVNIEDPDLFKTHVTAGLGQVVGVSAGARARLTRRRALD